VYSYCQAFQQLGVKCNFHFRPWRWSQYFLPKRWYLSTKVHDVTCWKKTPFKKTDVPSALHTMSAALSKGPLYFSQALSQDCQKWLLASSQLPVRPSICPSFHLSVRPSVFPSVRPSVRTEQLGSHVEKYSRARQATDDTTILRMRIACWIPKSTNTPTLIAFPLQ